MQKNGKLTCEKIDFNDPVIYKKWKVLADLNARATIRRFAAEKNRKNEILKK